MVNDRSTCRFKSAALSRRCFQIIGSIVQGAEEAAMPFLFFMVFPLALWDTMMCPPAGPSPTHKPTRKSQRATSREAEPWGRLTP